MKREDIINKANKQLDKKARDFGFNCAWCALFIDFLFDEYTFPNFCGTEHSSCTAQMNYFKRVNRWHDRTAKGIQPGDIVYYDWDLSGDADHVGLVVYVDDDKLIVVEGNYGTESYDKTRVARRTINRSYQFIRGFGVPEYEIEEPKALTEGKTTSARDYYDISLENKKLEEVKLLQIMLINLINVKLDIDGFFGPKTRNAVIEFQKTYYLTADGIAGTKTISKLCSMYFFG